MPEELTSADNVIIDTDHQYNYMGYEKRNTFAVTGSEYNKVSRYFKIADANFHI